MDTEAEAVLTIVVPGEPKAWQRAGHRIVKAKDGRQFVSSFTPAQTRSEQGAMKMFAMRAMEGRLPLQGPIDFRLMAYLPVPRSWSNRKREMALRGDILPTSRPDLDNYGKMKDALKCIVWEDDSQVTDEHLWKRYSDRPRVVIEVRPLGLAAHDELVRQRRTAA